MKNDKSRRIRFTRKGFRKSGGLLRMNEIYLLKSTDGLGYAVFTKRSKDTETCIEPYTMYVNANLIVCCYQKLGYKFRGIKHEVDML